MRYRPVGTAWQKYVFAGSRASHWLRVAFMVGLTTFGLTVMVLLYSLTT
ncbi:hypothetical protein [Nocardia huaxiensis]|uniref:Uncharacterized protein n=1 Tax=Nocardia huaxiensis TaxID=2755382 RepID=A0A7D6VE46_9NOCA|nr:hypothetical protein [Nocardia huaxiensis]QLY33131.1 hypothetical protein H0264_13645 [Nocardia huaxiensis]UFS93098.1 hypothetical protein LPY97_19715 [Nocardia huaxiensis]